MLRMMHPWRNAGLALSLWTAALMLVACPGPDYPRCRTDQHCADKGEICVYGECHRCSLDSHCDAPKVCLHYRCEDKPTCNADADCQEGRLCRNGSCAVECVTDRDCSDGKACRLNRCVVPPRSCGVHADCEAGDACRNGQCFTPKETDPEYGDIQGGAEPVAEPAPAVNEGASGADLAGSRAVCGAESRIFFDFNVSAVRDDSRAELARIAACLKENASARLVLQGHTDDRGSTEYNLALGERRSLAVRLYLKNMGADPERLRLVSLGEERPLDDGHDEAAYARNRRVEILPAP